MQEGDANVAGLVRQDLDTGKAAVTINRDVDVVLTLAGAVAELLLTVQLPATAVRDTTEHLHVDMQQITRLAMHLQMLESAP